MNGYFTCQKLSKLSKKSFTTTKETALAPFNLAHPRRRSQDHVVNLLEKMLIKQQILMLRTSIEV